MWNMKQTSWSLRFAKVAFVLVAMVACQEEVPRSDRFVPEDDGVLSSEAGATLLVEKFTGQRCINCPAGAKLLHKLGEEYPNRMITVAHHAASSRLTLPELESEASEMYAKALVSSSLSLPGVILSRRKFFGSRLYSTARGEWSGKVKEALRTPRSYRIALKAKATTSRDIELTTSVEAVQPSMHRLMLQIWVVEDMWGKQLGEGGGDGYHHEHVMRGYLNGAWGQEIALPYLGRETYTLPLQVVSPANAKVVAFVYDAETREVYEVSITPISGIEA